MSRRYGRNQKRRHRLEIEGLKAAVQNRVHVTNRQGSEIRELEIALERITETIKSICEYSIALPPEEIRSSHSSQMLETMEVVPQRTLSLDDLFIGDFNAPIEPLTFVKYQLHLLKPFLRQNDIDFSAHLHLKYYAGVDSGYMISEDALRTMPTEQIVKHLLPEITHLLVEYLKRGI